MVIRAAEQAHRIRFPGRTLRILAVSVGLASIAVLVNLGIARVLTSEGRGLVASVLTPYSIVLSVATGGLAVACANQVVRKYISRSRALQTASIVALPSGIVAGGLWVSIAAWTGILFESRSMTTATLVVALAVPLSVLGVCWLEIERQQGAGAIYDVLRGAPVVVGAFGVALVLVISPQLALSESAMLCSIALVIPHAVVGVLGLVGRRGERTPSTPFILCGILRFARPAWPSAITDSLLIRVDQLVLIVAVTTAQLGVYAMAASVASSAGLVRSSMISANYRRLHDGGEHTRRIATQLIRWTLVVCICVYLIIGLVSWWLLPVVLGPTFAGIGVIVVVLMLGQLGLDLQLVSSSVLYVLERPGKVSAFSFIGLSVNLAALAVLVPIYGILGAAMASLVAYWISGASCFWYTKRLLTSK